MNIQWTDEEEHPPLHTCNSSVSLRMLRLFEQNYFLLNHRKTQYSLEKEKNWE